MEGKSFFFFRVLRKMYQGWYRWLLYYIHPKKNYSFVNLELQGKQYLHHLVVHIKENDI